MNTILVAVEDDSGLRLPSGEEARIACGVANRQTWKRTKQTIGVESDVMTEDEMIWAVVCQRFIAHKNRDFSTHEVFRELKKQQSLAEIIDGLSELGKPTSKQEIINFIRGNYKCLRDSQTQSRKSLKPLTNGTTVKLQPNKAQRKQLKKEPLLVL